MTPANIVGMSELKNLDVIAVTDHNSCKNCPPVLKLAERAGIVALPGMELCTMEEVHVLCFFAKLENAMRFDAYVTEQLMKIPNDENAFGKQQICDEDDNILSTEPYLLINATNISFDHLGKLMKEFQGVYIPAHMDKNSNSLLSNLGFISPDADFLAAELAYLAHLEELTKKNPYLKQCNIITDSDAHELGKINEAVNYLECESRDKEDILRALVGNRVAYNNN
jgi:PHP family Zn ribbon phosphoesterase